MTDKKYFDPVDPRVNFPQLEEDMIKYWKEKKIFERSIEEKDKNKTWTFLDGPPFITGMPHYGTLLSSIPKDIFPRYKAMNGFRVRRVWGWDCHGLPAENKVENKLGIKRKKDIEDKIGVKKFIDECKLYVSEVSSEWEWYVDHIGRWVDFKNAYKTMDTPYMETVMWVFKQMYDKGSIYKGLRVSLFCTHCSTPISNFEVAMDPENYQDVTESADTYKYQLADEKDTYFLAWSTTPWTKIVTPALAVNPKLTYVKVLQGKDKLILAKTTLGILKDEPYKVLEEYTGKDLVGKKFIPHYDYYKIDPGKKAFIVIGGDFVTSDEGTGIVTIAAYGEEDLEVMERENIQIAIHLDDEGHLLPDVPQWGGMFYKDVDALVNEDLKARGLHYKEEQITHSVPLCWRCHTRLIYAPQNAWYVDIQSLKPKLKETNEKVNWYPDHFKYGRYLKSLESAPDWCISRSRYWGSPVPVWECECGERFVPGSIKELEEASGRIIKDLHKPEIDEVIVKCPKCGKTMKRVPEVLDSWIEAGSASFAERHFPFNKDVKLDEFFPPDFITEYTGQIRAWFYVLHVIGTTIYDSNAFKNVLVTGVVLGTDGRKMSKNFGNYPDPKEMITKYGGDALRLYLMDSPVMKGEDIRISEETYRNQIKEFMLTFWNVYNYFVTYATIDNWVPGKKAESTVLDQWINLRLEELKTGITKTLDEYNTVEGIDLLKQFVVNDLSLWYIRRSRSRTGPSAESEPEKNSFYQTTFEVLKTVCLLMAPFAPFVSDVVYRNLTKEESVHLADWPEVKLPPKTDQSLAENLIEDMKNVRQIVEKIHAARKLANIPVSQPLAKVTVGGRGVTGELLQLIKGEVNIREIKFVKGEEKVELDTTITPELEEESKARKLIRKIQEERKNMGMDLTQKVDVTTDWLPEDIKLLQRILQKALVNKLTVGEFSVRKS